MYLLRLLKDSIDYFGVPKEKRFDNNIKEIIIKKAKENDVIFRDYKIELLYVKKTNMKEFNEFNYFEFKYMKKYYTLLDNKLSIVNKTDLECMN